MADLTKDYLASPPLPSLERFRHFWGAMSQMSLTRALQYEMLNRLPPLGHLLDVGGGAQARYLHLISYDKYESLNIDADADPTWTVGINENFPCSAAVFDSVISLNTFEHIFNVSFVQTEILRVLKVGGHLYAAVPFLYPLHAHPDDFFRPTSSWLYQSLAEVGFRDIRVTPLGWGPYSAGAIASGAPGPAKKMQYRAALLADLFFMTLQRMRRPIPDVEKTLHRHALAFFVSAKK